jgi:hypothetical protein
VKFVGHGTRAVTGWPYFIRHILLARPVVTMQTLVRVKVKVMVKVAVLTP